MFSNYSSANTMARDVGGACEAWDLDLDWWAVLFPVAMFLRLDAKLSDVALTPCPLLMGSAGLWCFTRAFQCLG